MVVDVVPDANTATIEAFTFVGTPKTALPDLPFAELGEQQG